MNIFQGNFTSYSHYLPIFLISFLFTLFLTPIVGFIGKKYKIIDLPGGDRKSSDDTRLRRIHTEAKLKLGGVAVIIPFLILSLLTVPVSKFLVGFMFAVFALLLTGILDDLFELYSKVQAIMHIFAACLIVFSGLEISYISNPFGQAISLEFLKITFLGMVRYLPAALLTIFWITFIINAVKWVAGTDGLVEGNGAIAAAIIALLSVRFQTGETANMGFILTGGLLGFLVFNFYPSKILSGSAGKSVYGFILAVLAIYSGGKMATFLLTLSLPLIDAVWVIFYRIKVHKPKTIFALLAINDKTHIHHRLLAMGMTQKQVAFSEYTFTLIVGLTAFLLTGMLKAVVLLIVFLTIFFLFIGINIYRKREKNENIVITGK